MKEIDKYPCLKDIKSLCKIKVPDYVWEYLDSSTGSELNKSIDREKLDSIILETQILKGALEPNLSMSIFDQRYSVPFGVSPVGMSGLVHAGAEQLLFDEAVSSNFPYVLPTLGTICPENIVGDVSNLWFQLYCPKDTSVLYDILDRVSQRGIRHLVVTVDLPGASVRERQLKSGLTIPPKLNIQNLVSSVKKPSWLVSHLLNGKLELETLNNYTKVKSLLSTNHVGYQMRVNPDLNYLDLIRKHWKGILIVKGLTNPYSVKDIEMVGADSVWVSNHGGRQFQSGKASIDSLVEVRSATAMPIIFDGSVETGLDIIKAYVSGANFVMLGRAWHYALGAFGKRGPRALTQLLMRDVEANMHQLGWSALKHG